MKILYVTTQNPWPAVDGGRIRNSKIIEGLSREHDVVLALAHHWQSFIDLFMQGDGTARQWQMHVLADEPPSFAQRLLGRISKPYRHLMLPAHRNRHRKAFLRLVSEVKPDLVWFYQHPALWPVGHAEGIPCVFDMDNIELHKYERTAQCLPFLQRLMINSDLRTFAAEERRMAQRSDVVLLAGPDDASVLGPNVNLKVMPNGFDFPDSLTIRPRTTKQIMFIGWLDYAPNIDGLQWFCEEVWPRVLKRVPDASLCVVGKHKQYSGRVERLSKAQGVTFRGFVENVNSIVEQSALLIVPLRIGGGTRIKILEAWAKGLPVVSTGVGCEGLGAENRETALIADSADDFAQNCIELLESPQMGQSLAAKAYKHGKCNYDWKSLYPILNSVAEEAVSRARSKPRGVDRNRLDESR